MKSAVADSAKAAQREKILAMSPSERVELALALGRRSVSMYAQFHGISEAEARARLRALKDQRRG